MKHYRNLFFIIPILAIAIFLVTPYATKVSTHLGLDLVGGAQVLLEVDVPAGTQINSEAMDTARTIVENRVNARGVSEAVVQRAGERFIVVELPGEADPEKAVAAIKQTGLLEFVDMSVISANEAYQLENQQATIRTDVGPNGEIQPPLEEISPTYGATITPTARLYHTVMTGVQLDTVNVERTQVGQFEVFFTLKSEGAQVFAEFTKNHVNDILAIVLDKKVISAPRINNAITEGKGSITVSFTQETANDLAVQLRYGSLPIPLKVAEFRTVGPTLGQDSLFYSLRAGIIGFCIVILFMGIFYRLPGLVAIVSILSYAVITFALFRAIPVTLTLPGIAGLMLSTGSALDANILIFERMKEELRAGKLLDQAISQGWQRALPSIRDSNIATIITCAILYYFGSAFGATIVKGFSVTLLLGVIVSLFTAIIVTRTILRLVVNTLKPTNLSRWFGT